MPRSLPVVPRFTDCKGRPIGHGLFTPLTDPWVAYNPPLNKFGAPPLWNALNLSIPLSAPLYSAATSSMMQTWAQMPAPITAAIPATPFSPGHVRVPAVSWVSSTNEPIWETTKSLDRAANSIGGGAVSPPSRKTNVPPSRYAIPALIQGVGSRSSAVTAIVSIQSFLEQMRYSSGEWRKEAAFTIRMETMKLVHATFSACHDIAPSMVDITNGNDTWAIAAKKANDVLAFMTELIKMGVMTPGDLAVAAAVVFENRHRRGYMLLLKTVLEAAEYFGLRYTDRNHLKGVIGKTLRMEGGLIVDAIIRTIYRIPLRSA